MLFVSTLLAFAGEEAANEPAALSDTQQQVRVMSVQAQEQSNRVDALANYVSDLVAFKEGRAPKGWILPPLSAYQADGAPASFLPAEPPVVVMAVTAPSVPTVRE